MCREIRFLYFLKIICGRLTSRYAYSVFCYPVETVGTATKKVEDGFGRPGLLIYVRKRYRLVMWVGSYALCSFFDDTSVLLA